MGNKAASFGGREDILVGTALTAQIQGSKLKDLSLQLQPYIEISECHIDM